MKERLNKVTRGAGKVTIPIPHDQPTSVLAGNALYLQCKRRDYGLSNEQFEVLTIILTLGKTKGISASAITSVITNLPSGKTATFKAIQMKLTWLYRNGWVDRRKVTLYYTYTPAKKAINFFKVEKPAA